MRAEAIGMRLQRGPSSSASLLLGKGDQAGGSAQRRGLGAARAKAGFGHARRRNRLPARRLRRRH